MRRLFCLLLFVYPAPFRRVYGADMCALFDDRYREARERRCATRFLLRTFANLLMTACAERIAPRPRPGPAAARSRGARMSSLFQDVRYAARLLRRQPAYTLFVVLTLAVGIGANTAVFSVINRVLLQPLPYPASDELVRVWGRFDPESGFDFPQFSISGPEYLDYKTHTRAMRDVAAMSGASLTVGGAEGEPERVQGVSVTANLFSILQVNAAEGRTFTEAETQPNAPPVAILSHGFWQSRYGGDRGIVGRTVTINGAPATIVGVMPQGFAFPRDIVRMWVPLRIDPANPGSRQSHGISAIGRLAPGVPFESARAEIETLMHDWRRRFPDIHTGHYLFLRPLLEDVAGSIRPALLLLLGATGFVLLIVCANLASVVLARGEARIREMAIRGALGAGRNRLVRLALVESTLLAGAGGAIGVLLAAGGVRALIALDPSSIPRASEVGVDYRMLLFAAAVSALCAVLFGLMPAIKGARAGLQHVLREASQSTTGGTGRQWFRRTLVGIEVALTVVLVLGAGLMLRSFDRLLAVDPGFQVPGVLTAGLSLPLRSYREPAKVDAFYDNLLSRLAASPAVTSVSAGSTVPLFSGAGNWDFDIEGRPAPAPGEPAWGAKAVIVRPGYFEVLGVPILRGRSFNAQDDARSQPVVIVNQALVAKFFKSEDPIGRRIRIAGVADGWMTVVGVSGNVRTEALDTEPPPAYHFLQTQLPRTNGNAARALSILLRTDAPDAAAQALRAAVKELDPALALYDVQTMETVVDRSVARPRFTAWLLGLFAGIGLLLGASGIYGVLAYTVARRTQEIGIRRALGATSGELLTQVVTGGLVPVTAGIVAGLAAAYWSTRFWATQLFGVSPADPIVYAAVAAGVLVVAIAAILVPAVRALRISPLVALRSEGV